MATGALAAARDCGGDAEGGFVEAELASLRDALRLRRGEVASLHDEIKTLKGKLGDEKEVLQSVRAAVAGVPCQAMHKELAKAEERYRAAKREVVERKERESGDCQNVLKEERGKWQDRMFGVMGVTLRAQTKAFECLEEEESPEDAAAAVAVVRTAHADNLKLGDRVDKQPGTNLNAPADDGLLAVDVSDPAGMYVLGGCDNVTDAAALLVPPGADDVYVGTPSGLAVVRPEARRHA